MRKTINLFSRVLVALVLSAGLVVTGCYDDSAIQDQYKELDEQLQDHESRLKELERLVAQQNTNIESLQTIVTALQERDYVTSVAPIKEGDDVIGYTITFSKSGAVTIYNGSNGVDGIDGQDGKPGQDGHVPLLGVKQDESDGQWYWTVDGEWLTDSDGKKVRASAVDGDDGEDGDKGDQGAPGVTPQLKIVDGYWYVSYDGGETWEDEPLGQATGDKGYTMFTEVSYDDDYLYITMADGTKLTLPRASSSQGEGGEGEGDVVQVGPVTMKLSEITASTVTFTGAVTDTDAIPYIEKITVYYKEASETFSIFSANSASTSRLNSDNTVSITIRLPYNTSYSYCLFVESRGVKTYSDVKQFTTVDVVPSVSVVESSITATTASFSGTVTGLSDVDKSSIQVGMAYSLVSADLQSGKSTKIASGDISEEGTYSMSIDELAYDTKYYFCSYVKQNGIYKYGEVKEFTTVNVVPAVSVVESSITATTVSFSGTVTGLSEIDKSLIQVGMAYSLVSDELQSNKSIKVSSGEISEEGTYSMSIDELAYDTKYYFCSYVKQNGIYKYGEVKEFTTVNVVPAVSVDESSINATSASFTGIVTGLSEIDKSSIQVGMAYSSVSADLQSGKSTKIASGEISEEGTYSMSIDVLAYDTKYYFCSYVKQNGIYKYGEVKEFVTIGITLNTPSDATDLSASSTANCYIVSQPGKYCFKIYKGNSSDFIGRGEDVPQGFPSFAAVLWETFGTSTAPSVGDLVKNVTYKDGYITFEASDKKGNAVIAAKDASGNILWSWHIWLTDQTQAQVYNNNAGTMMDRNLGATSATPGDVGALGLLYQWGRKDPFLGSSSISSDVVAKSTLTWPSAVESTSSTGTIDYVTANPTTFVTYNSNNYDWYYTGSSSTDNTRWQSEKTIYDPCPSGWRVPDGGSSGVWSTALGSSSSFINEELYDSTSEGINFSGKFGTASTIWYPASGYRSYYDGGLDIVGRGGYYWSVTPIGNDAYSLYFDYYGLVSPSDDDRRASGYAVRCLQE